MNLTELRTTIAGALETVDPDWTVHPAPVDAAQPPAFMLSWAEPWLTPASWCQSYAAVDVIAIAARLEPDAQYETLEAMVAGAYGALAVVDLTPVGTSTPAPMELAQVTYLTARMHVRNPVAVPTTAVATGRFG